MTILSKDVEDELVDILRKSVERVEGKSYVLQRKIFVMINFLRERGYKFMPSKQFALAKRLKITSNSDTFRKYRDMFDEKWEEERQLIEAAESDRKNERADCDEALDEAHKDEAAAKPGPKQGRRGRDMPSKSTYQIEVGEIEIGRFRKAMSTVNDMRDARGKRYQLTDFLTYYVFRQLSAHVDKLDNADHSQVDIAIQSHMRVKHTIPQLQWVKDVVHTKSDSKAFRLELLGWLEGFEIDAAHKKKLQKLLLDENLGCEDMMQQLRSIVTFSVLPRVHADVASSEMS